MIKWLGNNKKPMGFFLPSVCIITVLFLKLYNTI